VRLPRLRRRRHPDITLERQPDALPRRGLFTEPVRVTRLDVLEPEHLTDGSRRAAFRVEVRDAEDRRCPEVAVEARLAGPVRDRTVQGTTDLLGRIRFRMSGPPGRYTIEITDVGAGGLGWDTEAGPCHAELHLPET